MTYVDTAPSVDAAVQSFLDDTLKLFGVSPPRTPRPATAPPAPDPTFTAQTTTFFTGLVNLMRQGMGIATLDPARPVDIATFDREVTFNVRILGYSLRDLAMGTQDGFTKADVKAQQYAEFFAGQAVNAARAGTAGSVGAAAAQLQAQINAVHADAIARANAAQAAAISALNTWVAALVRSMDHVENNLATLTWQLHNGAEADIAHARDLAAAEAAQAQRNAVAYTDAQVGSLSRDMAGEVNTLHGQIGNALATAEGYATGLVARAIPDAVGQAVAQVQPQLDQLKTETDTCLAPLCDTVTPNAKQLGKLGQALKNLEGVGILALLAALVAEGVRDPETSAHAVVDAAGWAGDVGVELVQAVT